jgi:hypothetical protein
VAGALAAPLDIQVVAGIHTDRLGAAAAADLLNQYRFLRAIEAGFGGFVITQWRRIYEQPLLNLLFLAAMGFGILARLLSIVVDGMPSWPLLGFLASEVVGIAVIFLYTRRTVVRTTG